MKKLFSFCVSIFIIGALFVQVSFAQLTGTKTIPGNYATIAAAIIDLNAVGVGSGGVTFNIAAGYTETTCNLVITATGTASNQIIFQKSGSGANPKITAGVGIGTMDGIILLSGADYVTFDGIDLLDPATNTTATTQMEWGFALLKVDATNGSQWNTIRNCSITLQKANTTSYGIYAANHTTASTTALTVTVFTGTNSGNRIYSNSIQNCYSGIYVGGYADATSPYAFYDHYNQIGMAGGNTIRNFGGSSVATYGIYTLYQDSLAVNNNDIGGGTGSTSTCYGVYIYYGYNSSVMVYNNTVSDTTASTTSASYGIGLYYAGYSGTDNTVMVKRNTVQGMTTTAWTSATFYGYYLYYIPAYNIIIDSNKFINNKLGGTAQTSTGTLYGMYIYPYTTSPVAGSTQSISNNYIAGNKRTQSAISSGTLYGMYIYYGAATVNAYNNIIENDTLSTTTGTSYYMYVYNYYSTTVNYYNNAIRNIYKPTGSNTTYMYYISNAAYSGTFNFYNNTANNFKAAGTATASVYGIYNAASSVTKNFYGNTAYTLQTMGSGNVYGIYQSSGTTANLYKNSVYDLRTSTGFGYGFTIASGTTVNAYNNYISDIRCDSISSTLALMGLYISGGTNVNAYYNTIYLNSVSTGTSFGTAALYASTTPTVDLRNNIIVNNSTPGTLAGYNVAYYRSAYSLTSYSNLSNNNNFYAGTPDTNHIIYYDGTNYIRAFSDYKDFITPRDGNSVTENSPFVNVSTKPYDLRINAAIATQCEGTGSIVSSPISITDDFDGQARYPNTGYPVNPSYPPNAPDIGADEFGGIPKDMSPPNIVYTPLSNTTLSTARTLTSTITDGSGVPTSGIGLPRLFWRRNMGSWDSTTATYAGSNQFSFTFGAGAVAGDTVKYYVVAQDTLTPPNVGTFPAGGAGIYSASPPRAGRPPTTPSRYLIVQSPMSGVFTIPGSYPSFAAAENDMFERGIGGSCTFNVAAGYTETLVNFSIRTTGTSSSPIIFQKSGSGANPKITAGAGTGTMDGIVIFPGTDYITFDGIDLLDPTTNTTATTQMEWGYALLKTDGTNGSQNITIKNCSITLQKVNASTYGIYSANHNTISTTALTVTAFSGTNSNNKFYNNTVQNCYSGIFIGGYADATPYVYYDNGNDIGSLGGNTIRNFGGGSATTYGIYTTYQDSLAVSNNNVGGGTGSTAITYGIYIYYGYNANATIYNNTVSDTTASTSSTTYGIAVYYVGNSGVDNTVNVKRNTVQGMTNTGAGASAALYGYYIYYTTSNTLYIDSNKFINNKWGNATGTFTGTVYSFYNYTYTTAPTAGSTEYITNNYIGGNKIIQSAQSTASYYGMYNYYGLATVHSYNNMVEYDTLTTTSTHYGLYMYHYYSTLANIYNNTVRNIYKIDGSTGSYYGIYLSNAAYTGTCNYYNNSVYNISCGVSTAPLYGQYLAATSTAKNVYGNTVHDLWATTSGIVYGIYQSGGTTVSLYKNSVYNLRTATGTAYGMYISSGTTNYIYNNYISDIRADSTISNPAIWGLYISGGTTDYIFYNTIYLNAVSTGTTFGTAGIYASTTPTVDLRNNNVVNVSTPGATGGYTCAYYRSSSTITSYSNSSNCNNFYAGTPDTNHIIYWDGTNYMRTLADYKTFVSPRDGNSVTENPPFVNVITKPYDLHINASTATKLESMGIPISSPIAITTDFDDNARYPNTGYPVNPSYPPIYPDIGADEFGGIPNYPVPSVPTLVSPVNGSTGNALSLNLVWNKKQYGIKYHILLATDSNFTNIIVNDSTLTDSVKAVSNLNTLTTYYWKVRTGNYSGWSSYSGWYSFKTVGVPTQVVCYSPANGALNQPVNITFVWYKAVDQTYKNVNADIQSDIKTDKKSEIISDNKSDSKSDIKSDSKSDIKSSNKSDKKSDNIDAVSNYWLEYTTDSTFATGVVVDSSLTDSTKSVTGLALNTKYWWRVKAKNQIGWGVFSSIWNFKTVAYLQLNLKCYLEGSWNGTTQISDTIRIYLALGAVPFTLVDSQTVMLGTNGTSNPMFTSATSGNYYIVVKHRNHLETWSALPQTFVAGTPLNYDFTTDSTKAFGMNMKKIGTGWAFIVGDANQDGSIDASDVVDNLIPEYGNIGYLSCDFNGDGSVDAADIPFMIANYGMAKYVPSEPLISPEIRTQKRMIKQQELNQLLVKKTKKTNNNN
jgi:hypothetical protein